MALLTVDQMVAVRAAKWGFRMVSMMAVSMVDKLVDQRVLLKVG